MSDDRDTLAERAALAAVIKEHVWGDPDYLADEADCSGTGSVGGPARELAS